MSSIADDATSRGPICPNCRLSLRENLRHEQTFARDSAGGEPLRAVNLERARAKNRLERVSAQDSTTTRRQPS